MGLFAIIELLLRLILLHLILLLTMPVTFYPSQTTPDRPHRELQGPREFLLSVTHGPHDRYGEVFQSSLDSTWKKQP